MAAVPRFGKPAHGVISLPGALLFAGIGELLDEMRQQPDVTLLPEQRAIGRLSVAAGTA
jgi:hypothetical protein